MNSIKTKIISAFLIIILMMVVITTLVIVVNFNLLSSYKKINENIVYEQQLKESVLSLIQESYKSYNSNDYSTYDTKLRDVMSITNNLDIKFTDPSISKETKIAYRSIKNSLNSVIKDMEVIRNSSSKEGSITKISVTFQKSMENFEFVKQNISDILVLEAKNIANITEEIGRKQLVLMFFIGLIILLTTILLLSFAFFFSRKITKPMIDLSLVAESISKGDLSLIIDKTLIDREDELGSLAKSFNIMLLKLREKIIAYETSNKELDLKVEEVTENNAELEKSKTVIVNLLEDFEEEKLNAENLVVLRTKELSDEKARLLASINSLSMGFAIIDNEEKFIINNPSILSILDMKEESITLAQISELLSIPEPSLSERIEKCVIEKCVIDFKEIIFGKKYLRLFLSPIFSVNDEPLGGVLLVEDITEAKILDRSRDEFFAVASHELRTPLTAIRGNTEMILEDYKDKIKDKNVISMLRDTEEASIRLISIVNDFLEVSRLEQGDISFKKAEFDIVEAAEKIEKSLKNEIKNKDLSFEIVNPGKDFPKIFGDKTRVEQVLLNLIGNAIKFTEKGTISTSFEIIDNYIKVRVSDTGKGISAKTENLLFRKFQPAGEDILVHDVTKNTGLGLYISKIIVEQMGGFIGLEKSEEGKGSVFYFTIPINS